MALNLIMTSEGDELKPRITVFGVGGAGGNAVNNMIEKKLDGVEFVVANTDAQALQQSLATSKVQLGVRVTEGLGAGAKPHIGAAAAEESIEQIVDHLAGAHMCFITAGMGGGTGTGAAPIIAQAARELGVLTVGVVTKPFQFEGGKRMRQAEEGIEALQKVVDTLIIIPNQNLFRLANERTTFTEAFAMADDVLYQGVKGVTDLMVRPGLINLDFADVRAVMDEMGKAMMGTGEATGEDRAVQAAEKAIANPLLDEISLNGARGVLINITGGYDLTLFELDEAANIIREKVDPEANIIVGSTLDTSMEGVLRVSVVATGIDMVLAKPEMPVTRRPLSSPLTPGFNPGAPASRQEATDRSSGGAFDPIGTQKVAREEQVEDLFDTGHAAAASDVPAPTHAAASTPQSAVQPAHAAHTLTHRSHDPQQDAMLHDEQRRYDPRADGRHDAHGHEARGHDAHGAARPNAPLPLGLDGDAAAFVAPQRRAPGAPSPEALERLRAAVGKTSVARPAGQGSAGSAQRQQPAQPPRQEEPRGRFGLGSLITRMAGHVGDAASPPQPAAPSVDRAAVARQAPQQPEGAYDDETDPDNDRIEIPAFLRRQAN